MDVNSNGSTLGKGDDEEVKPEQRYSPFHGCGATSVTTMEVPAAAIPREERDVRVKDVLTFDSNDGPMQQDGEETTAGTTGMPVVEGVLQPADALPETASRAVPTFAVPRSTRRSSTPPHPSFNDEEIVLPGLGEATPQLYIPANRTFV